MVWLLAGSCFVYPNNGCFSSCVTDGAGDDRNRQARNPEENLSVIKTQERSGCLTFVAVHVLL